MVASGPLRSPIDADGAELGCARFLRRAVEHLFTPGDLEPVKTSSGDHRLELCIQQSAGDSTGPEVYSLLGRVGNGLLHEDVGDLQTATRPQGRHSKLE